MGSTRTPSPWAQNLVDTAEGCGFRLANVPNEPTSFPLNGQRPGVLDLAFFDPAATQVTVWKRLLKHKVLDHAPIALGATFTNATTREFRGYNWEKTNWERVANLLPAVVAINSEEDFNHAYHTLIHSLQQATPSRRINKWSRPWWNENLKEMRRVVNKRRKDLHAQKCNEHTYHAARNSYLRSIKKAKADWWNNTLLDTTPTTMWKTIQSAFPKPPAALPVINGNEIKAAIAAIPASSAPGDDTLTTTVWKNLHIVRPDYLTAMTDWSLRSRTLPALLKQVLAVVIPKADKPDYSVPKAYRMISLLPTLSKLQRLDSLQLLFSSMCKALLTKSCTLDLAEIMTENGFPPYLVDWIQSYLSCRAVKISDGAATEPSFTPIQYEEANPPRLKVSYVDDFALLAVSESWRHNATFLSTAANELQRQANRSGMNFDISKTELFHFPSNRTLVPRHHSIGSGGSMRAGYHIETRATKARKALYRIAPLLKKLRPETASRLVKALIIPSLTFGIEVFTRAHINHDEQTPLRQCLRAAAKLITGGWEATETRAMCAEAGLPAPDPLIKRCAILAACRLILQHVPWFQLCSQVDQVHAPPRLKYLQLDGSEPYPTVGRPNKPNPTNEGSNVQILHTPTQHGHHYNWTKGPPPSTPCEMGHHCPTWAWLVPTIPQPNRPTQWQMSLVPHTLCNREHLLMTCRAKPNNTDELMVTSPSTNLYYRVPLREPWVSPQAPALCRCSDLVSEGPQTVHYTLLRRLIVSATTMASRTPPVTLIPRCETPGNLVSISCNPLPASVRPVIPPVPPSLLRSHPRCPQCWSLVLPWHLTLPIPDKRHTSPEMPQSSQNLSPLMAPVTSSPGLLCDVLIFNSDPPDTTPMQQRFLCCSYLTGSAAAWFDPHMDKTTGTCLCHLCWTTVLACSVAIANKLLLPLGTPTWTNPLCLDRDWNCCWTHGLVPSQPNSPEAWTHLPGTPKYRDDNGLCRYCGGAGHWAPTALLVNGLRDQHHGPRSSSSSSVPGFAPPAAAAAPATTPAPLYEAKN
ncbi:hypothetical protein PCASD_25896 [Puccinia coronata f. sp. avenae]|uniref:Reverse transcriptase domain-containing protein n=1 Tax=Puccinia coronata f. sp. avenae TaxID=200324 RepID=A0A2N5TH59_9BASI|nr:hypothetical protein PCASD_25896 [Puccinia coronata f. sp. avenae]